MQGDVSTRGGLGRLATVGAAMGVLLSGCGVISNLNRPQETPTAVPPAVFEIVADSGINPDIHGKPKPILVRLYELRATAAFDRASYLDLQDKDETQLGADFVRREEILLQPGERRTIERKGSSDVRTFAVFAGYRDLERSTWRATIGAPNSVEMRRRWWGLGETERLKPVQYRITVGKDAVKIQSP
ncbi:type VI secretion system lipoprotein TssJ [Acidovorax sp. GBBC 3334]|uniref:type VI secretion system lipoprotein TssJ n=1 Tax=unclassified Acidovorax TaxID=2684926 RepID=UPI002303B8B5|nr:MULTISPECIES: type VI secretion system lipoprotein TssJ [unclassified Acidovorax]MDA8454128.1 type VI secretion system lipoprotein TssJ [Acidovorax sp. GBBC 3334]MDA8519999.1 type VI secretion system lipoprotein TssJ [Acidovorax sp. NCPPB 4044]